MSTVKIELDTKVVQRAVNAKVQPAVEKILATVDLPKRIEAALLARPAPNQYGDRLAYMQLMHFGVTSGRPAIEDMIDAAISTAAQAFIKKAIESERPKIEAAFKRMMADSANVLARTLLQSLEGGLKDEWRFTLDTTIRPKEIERY